jgi:hypothetical protein
MKNHMRLCLHGNIMLHATSFMRLVVSCKQAFSVHYSVHFIFTIAYLIWREHSTIFPNIYAIQSPLHTTRRPRSVLNYFRERSEDVVKIDIFCITGFSLLSLYVPCRFVLRPPRSHQVIITRTATRALRPPRLNCTLIAFLTTTRKTSLRVHHAPFTF